MREETGETYTSSEYLKSMVVGQSKEGKTVALVAGILGQLPWQTQGALVSRPENLHVLAFDESSLAGIKSFLTSTCKAPAEALKYTVWNFQEDIYKAAGNDDAYNHSLYNSICAVRQRIHDKVTSSKGVSAILLSSLTGLAGGIERSIMGRPAAEKATGWGGDQNKWQMFKQQLFDLQYQFQIDTAHCIWEAHLYKRDASNGQNSKDTGAKETIQVSGKAGQTWAYNVAEVFRLQRNFGDTWPGTNCDKVAYATRPTLDFIASGRNFTEALKPQEACLASIAKKLGKKVGGWGVKSGVPSSPKSSAVPPKK